LSKFWIGPSGWSYPDWEGVVYPTRPGAGFKPLRFIAGLFNAVEVNSSFYRTPTPRITESWPALVPRDFRFAFKLTRAFTHDRHRFPPRSEAAAFCAALRPVSDAGRLGPILMQFPWSFRYTPDAVEWLDRLAEAFRPYERFVEVRHTSWARPEALEALSRVGGYCNIDQPVLRDCLPPTTHVFGRNAYARFHGRNAAHWFAENQAAFERYNYLYTPDELREWVARLNEMARQAQDVYVFSNNHYRGQGVANALEIRALLGEPPRAIPSELLAAYPRLAAIAAGPRQPTLFDPRCDA
jgi:uncharacterized protein YecE (DUF72 family)